MCVVGIEWWRGLLSEVKFSPSAQLRERKREGMATARAAPSSATAVESVKLEDTLNRAWKDGKIAIPSVDLTHSLTLSSR